MFVDEMSRTVFHYRTKMANKDTEIEEALARLAGLNPEMGFGKFHAMLRREGKGWNHKRVNRVYCEMKLNKRRKHKRRLPARNPDPLSVPQAANHCRSADFMSDALWTDDVLGPLGASRQTDSTMDLSSWPWQTGPKRKESSSNSRSPASRCRTASSNALNARTTRRCLICTSSRVYRT